MKPTSNKKNSPYNKLPRAFFTNNRRRLLGYLVMLFLFGWVMLMISQDLKPGADPIYEVVHSNDLKVQLPPDAGAKHEPAKAAKPVVVEAPKGGIANEGSVVGNPEPVNRGRTKGKDPHVGYKAKIIESEDKGVNMASQPQPMPKKVKMSVDDIIEDSDEKRQRVLVSKKDLEESDEYYVHVHD